MVFGNGRNDWMKRVLGIILAVMVALGLWAMVVAVGAREGWLLRKKLSNMHSK